MIKRVRKLILLIILFLFALLIPKIKSKEKVELSAGAIGNLLKKAFGEGCHLFLVDRIYRVPSLESVREFLVEDKTDLFNFVDEYYDCDNYSFRLMGNFSIPGWADIPFGIATSEIHAYNCVVALENGDFGVWIIEPQTDELIKPQDIRGDAYKTVFCMM